MRIGRAIANSTIACPGYPNEFCFREDLFINIVSIYSKNMDQPSYIKNDPHSLGRFRYCSRKTTPPKAILRPGKTPSIFEVVPCKRLTAYYKGRTKVYTNSYRTVYTCSTVLLPYLDKTFQLWQVAANIGWICNHFVMKPFIGVHPSKFTAY